MIFHPRVVSSCLLFLLHFEHTKTSFLNKCARETNQQKFLLRTAIYGLLLLAPCVSTVEAQTNIFPADGNVGVGTMSPGAKVHTVVNSPNTDNVNVQAADIGLMISNSTANNLSVISFANSWPAGQAQIGVINIGSTATSGGHLFFNTRAAGGNLFERMRITSAGYLGIGTTAPTSKLTVSSNAAPLPATATLGTTIAHFSAADASNSRVLIDSFGSVPAFDFRRANNTAASPSSILSDDNMGQISWFGRAATGYGAGVRASIKGSAAENWSDTAQGTYLSFSTTPKTTATPIERLRISDAGNVGIGTLSPSSSFGGYAALHISNAQPDIIIDHTNVASYGRIAFRDNGTERGTLQFIGSGFGGTGRQNALELFSKYGPFSIWTGTSGTPSQRVLVDTSGYVGIGIATPVYKLHVGGGQINASGGLCIAGNCKTAWSQVTEASHWTTSSGPSIHYTGGTVGIGSVSP